MEVTYGSVGLHTFGELTVVRSGRMDPPESPQREIVSLRVEVNIFCGSYAQGQEKVRALRAACSRQHQPLSWVNPADPDPQKRTYLSGPASVSSIADSESWGTYHRRLDIEFELVLELTPQDSGSLPATLKYGTPEVSVALGNVLSYVERYQASRPNPLRCGRDAATGSFVARGFIAADPQQNLADRRTTLLAAKTALQQAAATRDAKWTFADRGDLAVRVESLDAEIDQALRQINWNLTATWDEYAAGAADAVVKFSVATKQARESNSTSMTFSGVIRAPSRSTAESRLTSLRDAVLSSYEPAKRTVLRRDATMEFVSVPDEPVAASADLSKPSAGFLELSFTEEYMIHTGNALGLSVEYSVRSRDDLVALSRSTTGSGSVYAGSAVLDAILSRASQNFLDQFLDGMAYGVKTVDERAADLSYTAQPWEVGVPFEETRLAESSRTTQKCDFSVSFEDRLTGVTGVLETELTEEVEFSGTRWIEQPSPDGPSTFQDCGISPGKRTVSGSVTAADWDTAKAWAMARRSRLSGPFTEPGRLSTHVLTLPVGGNTVKAYRVGFTWAEVLATLAPGELILGAV